MLILQNNKIFRHFIFLIFCFFFTLQKNTQKASACTGWIYRWCFMLPIYLIFCISLLLWRFPDK